MAPGVADGLPGGGGAPDRRLPRIHHRRSVHHRHPQRARHDPGVLQHLPPPGHPAGHRSRELRHRRDPLPVPRLAVRAGRHQQGGRRPLRLPAHHDRRRGVPEPDPGGPLGRLRLHQHGSPRRVTRVVPRTAPRAPRAVPLREDAVPLLPLGDPPGQLEVGARRLQRELSRPGHPSPAAPVVRRHGDSLRSARQAQPHGWAGRGQARDSAQSTARPRSRATTTSASCWPS